MVVAAALALACAVGCVGCLVYLHLVPTGYSPLRNAVSEYGVGRYAGWYRAQTTATAFAAIALAVALGGPGEVLVLLSVLAAARLLIGWFPTDTIQVGERTTRGGVHALLAVLAFTTATWAAVALRPAHHGLPALGWAMAACALGTALFLRNRRLRPYFGLIERGYYAAMLTWLIVISARLL